MSEILLNNGMHTNANAQTEHASASGTGASDGALAANEGGATYTGSTDSDVSYTADPPAAPEVPQPDVPAAPEVGGADAAGNAGATADAATDAASAHAEGAMSAAGGAGAPDLPAAPEVPDLPDVPEVPEGSLTGGLGGSADVAADGSGFSFDAMVDAIVDLMEKAAANVSGGIGAMFGF